MVGKILCSQPIDARLSVLDMGNNTCGAWKVHVSGMMVEMHELHKSVRRVCAGVSITLFAMTS
jgi:hypothetical protein